MRIILNQHSISPFFNLACEQYMLEQSGDIFMLWRNGRSVIIGKNQNAYSEVNLGFCLEKNIDVARRITGGGAVFHDIGNVNFTFITDSNDYGIDFARFINPVIDVLRSFGINAELDGRNDIVADGFKISGNAQTVFTAADGRKRLLHHGTLLFSADISEMTGALNPRRDKLDAKGVKSVSSRVKNIVLFEGYTGPKDVSGFMTAMMDSVTEMYSSAVTVLTEEEIAAIDKLRESKFGRWEWNYGSSPAYRDNVSKRFPYGTIEVSYSADRGTITDISISGDFFGSEDVTKLAEVLKGRRITSEEIGSKLANIGNYISGADADDFLSLFFG